MSRHLFMAALASSLAIPGASVAPKALDDAKVIEDVTLISPERQAPLHHASVVIRNGRIAEIGTAITAEPGAKRIDGQGKFLIPGLIDSHVHVGHSAALDDDAIDRHPELWAAYRAQVPRAYLAFGFTSVVDLDLAPPDRAWFESTPLHPQLYSCGQGIKVAGGYMAFNVPPASAQNFPNLVYEAQEAEHWPKSLDRKEYTPERAVARAADAGAICVKAFLEPGFGVFHWPYLHTATLEKIQAAANERHLALIVHANSEETWRAALNARADVIAHGLWIWPGDAGISAPPSEAASLIAEAARRHTRVEPTMQTVAGERAMIDATLLDDPRVRFSLPAAVIGYLRSNDGVKTRLELLDQYKKASPAPGFEPLLAAAIERTHATFRIMLQDHVRVILGSDTPGVDGFGNPPGLNGRLEIQDWADAGASLSLILRAATLDNAGALGLAHDVGSIEVGKRADLLLLRADPLESIAAYDAIATIILHGSPVARESLLPAN